MNSVGRVDVILIVGAKNRSSSGRLEEIGPDSEISSDLIANRRELEPEWLDGVHTADLMAGAAASEVRPGPGERQSSSASRRNSPPPEDFASSPQPL